MKLAIICVVAATIFAAPCIYDISSKEPSPLSGLLAASQAVELPLRSFAPSGQDLF